MAGPRPRPILSPRCYGPAVTARRETILILDFGSQYTQLIARRIREEAVYSEIHPFSLALEKIREIDPVGIVLSGGPASVYGEDAPQVSPELFDLGVPILGICYGVQLTAHAAGWPSGDAPTSVSTAMRPRSMSTGRQSELFFGRLDAGERGEGVDEPRRSHRRRSPRASSAIGENGNVDAGVRRSQITSAKHLRPSVSPRGRRTPIRATPMILRNFLFRICRRHRRRLVAGIVRRPASIARHPQGHRRPTTDLVICGLSGGVDSSVAAELLLTGASARSAHLHICRQRPAARRRVRAGRRLGV